MKLHSRFYFVSITLLLIVFTNDIAAATKYVSNSGNNNNSGNSWAQAWLTLQHASNQIAAGDTVWVADGLYTGFNHQTTGTATQPIVFIAAANDAIINLPCSTTDGINVENSNYIEINGFRVIDQPRNGIRLAFSHFCIVRNNYCANNFERGIFTGFTDDILIEYNECLESIDEHGIYVSNSSDRSIIRYNNCHHNNRGGIQINADASQGGDGISTDPEIYGNILYENGIAGGAAINLDGVQGAFIYNNLLYENHATGIALFRQDGAQPTINATVVHNTIVNATNGRWCILIVNGSTGAQVYNNILINQHPTRGSIAMNLIDTAGFNSDYNIVVNRLSRNGDGTSVSLSTWQSYGYDIHSQLADPLIDIFVVPGSDYHLLGNAQAVDEGNSAYAFGVNNDIEGAFRPQSVQHDIGAYEAGAPLAIDEDINIHKPKKKQKDIIVTSEIISWPDNLDRNLSLFTINGRMIDQMNTSRAGTYILRNLFPGIYILALNDKYGIHWSQLILITGH